MKAIKLILSFLVSFLLVNGYSEDTPTMNSEQDFQYLVEQFADLKIGRYQITHFEELTPKQKELAYYLYEAALSGRDMAWDQNFKYNLKIRRTLSAIAAEYSGNRETPEFEKFMEYTKRVWFSRGIHHHYSADKIQPEFSLAYFEKLLDGTPESALPLDDAESRSDLLEELGAIIFDPFVAPKRVNTAANVDLIQASCNNFYEGVSQREVESFYKKIMNPDDPFPVSFGLNSKLVRENGHLVEKTWKVGGMYSPAIEKVVFWLEKARNVAENPRQQKALDLLIQYYKTGDLKTWDNYSIAWLQDSESTIDVVNGFIETYGDPLGYRATFESMVSFRDAEATRRAELISSNAQWFEDHSPIMDEHKKPQVKGISAKVITVIALGGDASPAPPIGVNLPNANWIRKEHGSKSVTLGNITYAYHQVAQRGGMLQEFAYSVNEIEREEEFGELAGNLHTDMHEIIGHGSGQLNPGVAPPRETLKNYAAVMEETRADLVSYYYMMDPYL
ncbi:MAG: dihydrofolate reductase, partial [Calditrichia bacterium]